MKIIKRNGHSYSRDEFEGFKFRTMFRFTVSDDFREDSVIHIYTDCPDREEVVKVVDSLKKENLKSCELEHWTTKEQDELTSQFIEESLKDLADPISITKCSGLLYLFKI